MIKRSMLVIKITIILLVCAINIITSKTSYAYSNDTLKVTYQYSMNGKEEVELPEKWTHVEAMDKNKENLLIQANEEKSQLHLVGLTIVGIVIVIESKRRRQT